MKNDCGNRLQKLTEDYGFSKQCELADAILNYISCNLTSNYSFNPELDKNRLQSELSKIFGNKKSPGLEIILQIIKVLARQNHISSPLSVANKIIKIYNNQLNPRYIALIIDYLNDQQEDQIESIELSDNLSKIEQEWFKKYYFLSKDNGGLDWNDSHRKHPSLDHSIKDILKLLSECIRNNHFQHFKEIYQNIANFLQLYGYRQERLWLSKELYFAAERMGDLETSIQARASHTWSLVTDRKIDSAKQILSELIEEFKLIDEYDKKTNFAKIISFENLARIAILEGDFDLAQNYFNEQLQEIEFSKILNIELRYRTRYSIPIDYHLGRIAFYNQDYSRSLEYFGQAQQDAKKIDWTRMNACAQNWIAKIYIVQNQLTTAESLLQEGLEITKMINSRGRLGFYHQDLAILYKKRENKEHTSLNKEYSYHYHQASAIFNQLGMNNAIENLERCLQRGI